MNKSMKTTIVEQYHNRMKVKILSIEQKNDTVFITIG